MPISEMLFALLITIAVECLTAFVLGYREKVQIYIVVLVNVITNPLLNYILMVMRFIWHANVNIYLIMLLEAAVIIIEWRIMAYALRVESKKLLILSAVMNGVSYGVGVLIFGVG
jgi:hypothetical protein